MKRGRSSQGAGKTFKKPKKTLAAPTAARKKSTLLLEPELKFNDVAFTTDATTTGTIVPLNQMATGDTALLRDGNKILTKSVLLRIAIEQEAVAQNLLIRFLIVLDKAPNGVDPTIATAGSGPLDTITIQSLRRVDTISRFKILKDWVVEVNAANDTATSLTQIFTDAYIKLRDDSQITQFVGATSAAPMTNGLYLMYFSNVAAGVTDANITGQSRVRFLG